MKRLSTLLLTALLVLSAAPSAQAAIAFVNGTTGDRSGTPSSGIITTAGLNVTSGNFVAVGVVSCCSTARVISSVTDNAGNTYSCPSNPPTRKADAFVGTLRICYAKNVTGHAALSLTITFDTGINNGAAIVAQYSGVDTTAPFDTEPDCSAGGACAIASGATVTTTAFTPSTAGSLVFAVMNVASDTCGCTQDTGYTMRQQYDNGTDTVSSMGVQDKIGAATSSQTVSNTTSHSGSGSAIVAAVFKAASGGGGSTTPVLTLLGVGGALRE